MKTAELLPPLLDYWVAKAEGKRLFRAPPFDVAGDRWQWITGDGAVLHNCPVDQWHPSTDPAQGQPIIEQGFTLHYLGPDDPRGKWRATAPLGEGVGFGATALIAAMRAKVASVYGPEVPDL